MTLARKLLLLLTAFFFYTLLPAQVVLPAFTGYALPAEAGTEEDESILFSEKAGLHNWTDTRQQLQYFFNAPASGPLTIYLRIKHNKPGSRLLVSINHKQFPVTVPASATFVRTKLGTVQLTRPGFYAISIKAVKKAGSTIADLESIELEGAAAAGVQCNAKPRRNAASVHLMYPVADTGRLVSFYNELTIPSGADPLYSYFMACGFARGYFGIQVNSATERRVIFSVWDAGNEAADRSKVPEEKKVQLLAKGSGVTAEGFGNEGTGGHSHFVYNWKAGETYRFWVTALPDSATATTIYTGYFFMPELQQWKLIACFKAPEDGSYLHHLYSFVENFQGVNGQLPRKAFFGNQWTRSENGQWNEITTAKFSYDATGKAKDRIDYGGGVENNRFYLWNGGFNTANAKAGDAFPRTGTRQSPVIDLYKNADSAAQAREDSLQIAGKLSSGQLDTSGSTGGVYYKILKEGNGPLVEVTDTVVAFYKGSLLNGTVFDGTKDKPAVFPLNRLIKGWQIGLGRCKTGGKIQLIIPSALAYSIRSRSPKIPPNSVLVFEIEVLEARKVLSP